ncbi:endonuclease/exonuclease protein-like protein [Leptomonas pyrrhocoris]|uniref:Endonuclease/exonuclease protein-like protein n=1 Tax=Leptomonas pyrrhocoris TaxID=157538 RepID=A0A0N0DWC1_LEPPY|nr:endonuclease/exonuclease protein-like protein [Leptomonas pyrrhocoris]KPA81611.1 endonuclease/exonuclease protein-like protein [Leptomonas pyrrhocoris]|eukprot:XP_015660050.1 endonuclease/exonuclease protein-like protein [Leptomonas pyrrhocoris]
MFLISWNVAGWASTSQAIRESYGSLHDFFACTGADIICLQECKGSSAKLSASPVDMGASDPPMNRRPAVRPLARLAARSDDDRTAPPASLKTTLGGGGVNNGIEGWESFWSFSGKQHRGFNGVVTFARKGLTWCCDNQPFEEEEFNDEGRVVVTHHSAFVLVNVYVPNARGGARHDYKFGFLRALESVMEKLRRETKKPVMLVGDLNMTYRAFDGAWTLRRLHLGTLLQLEVFAAEKTEAEWAAALPHLPKAALQRVVNMITNYLCARVMEVAGANSEVGGGPKETSSVPTPPYSPLSPPSSASAPGTTSVVAVDAELIVDDDTIDRAALQRLCEVLQTEGFSGSSGRMTQMYEAPPLSLRALYRAGFRTAYASEFAKSFSCAHNNELYTVVRYCGLSPHSDASAGFMGRLLHLSLPTSSVSVLANRLPWETPASSHLPGDGSGIADYSHTRMFDSFLLTDDVIRLHNSNQSNDSSSGTALDTTIMEELERPQLRPYCPCPYTVWDQSRNRRLENVGTRLDYILIDAALLSAVECRRETANNVLPSTESTHASRSEFFSEVQGSQFRDGVQRAMAGGAYPPAPFDGSGMPALAESARELCCAGLPSTGLFVTPPQFSDHIGVGLVLNLSRLGGRSELVQRPGKLIEVHKCMYRPPVGLHTFFAAAASKKVPAADAPAVPSASTAGQKRGADEIKNALSGQDTTDAPQKSARPLKAARAEVAAALQRTTAANEAEVVDVDEL